MRNIKDIDIRLSLDPFAENQAIVKSRIPVMSLGVIVMMIYRISGFFEMTYAESQID